ncbi:MAG: flagellar biosynthesis protein FlhB [Desulfotomaculaceae bacterium]|nr:flagellar biosynthesis protein FlhB [Desulfotomaculaceae bacterium]
MAGSAQEKTEQATPRRVQEARRKGQVAKSTDLTGALLLLAMITLLYMIQGQFILDLQRYFTGYFSNVAEAQVLENSLLPILNNAALFLLKLVAPFFTVAVVIAVASNLAQVGFLFSTESLKPKPNVFNPVAGLQKMFSLRSLVELVKSVLKFSIIGGITYYLIKSNLGELMLVFNHTAQGIYSIFIGFIISVAGWGALAYLVLAVLDYMYQRYDYKKNLKMSKQEVKEEYKQTEGDPHIKSKLREMRRSMSMNRIISEVPQATVVVTNPTHLAVALKYRQGEMSAPVVVAKGAGRLAEKIKDIAGEHRVPVVEDKEVARFLYQAVETGQEIPIEIYQAVAQILAMVHRLKARENYRVM